MIMLPPSYHRVARVEIRSGPVRDSFIICIFDERGGAQEIAVIHHLGLCPFSFADQVPAEIVG